MTARPILMAAALLAATAIGAQAQAPIQGAAPYQARPATPQSWSYDPYTSGMTACVQANWGNLPHCNYFISPTYGQPSYWPTR